MDAAMEATAAMDAMRSELDVATTTAREQSAARVLAEETAERERAARVTAETAATTTATTTARAAVERDEAVEGQG
jgi:hypothetical protein